MSSLPKTGPIKHFRECCQAKQVRTCSWCVLQPTLPEEWQWIRMCKFKKYHSAEPAIWDWAGTASSSLSSLGIFFIVSRYSGKVICSSYRSLTLSSLMDARQELQSSSDSSDTHSLSPALVPHSCSSLSTFNGYMRVGCWPAVPHWGWACLVSSFACTRAPWFCLLWLMLGVQCFESKSGQGNIQLVKRANSWLYQAFKLIRTMYGKLNERRLNESDYIMSCEQAREELTQYMNDEAKRVNIDSAKKRAVVQHMDYDGFRQMVLGANIFPTKSKELYNFSKGESSSIPTNLKQEESPSNEKRRPKPQQSHLFEKVTGRSELHCQSFRQFKKKLKQQSGKELSEKATENCYNLIKQQNQQRMRRIFNAECQANILLLVCQVFDSVLSKMLAQENQAVHAEAGYMLMFFRMLLTIPTMKDISLAILTKRQKQTLATFVHRLKDLLGAEEDAAEIDRIHKILVQ